jgi:hypothetical protein
MMKIHQLAILASSMIATVAFAASTPDAAQQAAKPEAAKPEAAKPDMTVGDMIRMQNEMEALKTKIAVKTRQNELLRLDAESRNINAGAGHVANDWQVDQVSCGAAMCTAVLSDGVHHYAVKIGSKVSGMTVRRISTGGVELWNGHRVTQVALGMGATTSISPANGGALSLPPLPPIPSLGAGVRP